jgi:hypothetical protein
MGRLKQVIRSHRDADEGSVERGRERGQGSRSYNRGRGDYNG